MRKQKTVEFVVGLFMMLGILAFLFLALKVSGLTALSPRPGYYVTADFDNIGGLKVRAPVTIAGVRVGEVSNIILDPLSLRARVKLHINAKQDKIPAQETTAKILTEGLLGANYISIEPGTGESEDEEPNRKVQYLKEGSHIILTNNAMILENLIGELMFNIKK